MPSSKRKLSDWIDAYLEYTENSESPRSYHKWAGISVICGTLQRRVWMVWGHTTIFPNQYIILVGPSGARKGEPLVVAQGFLREVGVPLIAEAITRQALYRAVKNSTRSFNIGTRMYVQCAVSGVFEEVSVFLGEGDARFLASLTNWYDSRERWTYETKNAGVDEIHGICFNMLGSTAPDWIPLIIPYTAIGGGFTSRIIFVLEHKKERIIEDPNEVYIDAKLEADLHHDLELIYQMSGEFKFTPNAREWYKEWYRNQEQRILKGDLPIQDPRFSGYVSRRATHLKKLAMAFSASRSDDLEVNQFDIDRALENMVDVERTMPAVFSAVGRSESSEQTDAVAALISERKRVKRSEVMRLYYYDIDLKTMKSIEENLGAMQYIKITHDTKSGDVIYDWTGKAWGMEASAPARLTDDQ